MAVATIERDSGDSMHRRLARRYAVPRAYRSHALRAGHEDDEWPNAAPCRHGTVRRQGTGLLTAVVALALMVFVVAMVMWMALPIVGGAATGGGGIAGASFGVSIPMTWELPLLALPVAAGFALGVWWTIRRAMRAQRMNVSTS